MSGRGHYLKKHGGVPLDHPRRCQAHNRSKHFGREGQPCRRYAAKGATVCTMHGGAAPQVRRKALLRRYFELDQKAQAQAAINVFLPPELHPLVSGGGRGHRKAAKTAPEPAPPPPARLRWHSRGAAQSASDCHAARPRRRTVGAEPPRRPASSSRGRDARPLPERRRRPRFRTAYRTAYGAATHHARRGGDRADQD